MQVDIRLLGGFEVKVDGFAVPREAWRRRHPTQLVKILALTPGHRLHREQVIDALWPEVVVADATPRLHKAAHYARATLGARDAVTLADDMVALFPSAELLVDVDRFDALEQTARATSDLDDADAAIAVYQGDLLPDDLYEEWTVDARERRRLRYVDLLRRTERWADLVSADPTDEDAHLRVVHSFIDRGDRAGALRQLDFMEATLRRALDIEPSDAATALRDRALAMPIESSVPRARSVAVPRPATHTIGRHGEIARVCELIDGAAIVTLLGPGGVGKTRLATEVALRLADEGWDPCFVDLTRVRHPALVAGLIVRDLGVHLAADDDAVAVLDEAFRGQRRLLVLDNFEHVIDAAPIVGAIAQRLPELRLLVTSRARLRVAGETVVDVDPLDATNAGEAVQLFAQTATAVDPAFDLQPNLADVVAICEAVDGLPLAIELAAGHVRTLPPVLLRSRLGGRLGSSSAVARDAPERQQTIPAMIDWSLELVGAAERQLFVRLGVFESAVPLDAIEQVCAEPGVDVVDILARLVDQSLVRRTVGAAGPRFVLLELLRERARELLADEQEAMRARHADYVGRFLDDIDERRWLDLAHCWIDLIADQLAEVRAAHEWASAAGDIELAARITAALGAFWHRDGHHVEGRRWVNDSLARIHDLDELLAARVRVSAGFLEWTRDPMAAFANWDDAAAVFRRGGHDRLLAYVLGLSSGCFIGDPDQYDFALRRCEESIALARALGERPLIAQALNVKGELARVQGDDALALVAYEEGRELAEEVGDQAHITVFLANLSYLADHRGDYVEARAMSLDAIRMCQALGRRMMIAWTISELAGPEIGLGRPERGAVMVGAADEALRSLGVERHPGDVGEHRRVVDDLRAALGDERLSELRARGACMTLDEAVELALSDDELDVGASTPH